MRTHTALAVAGALLAILSSPARADTTQLEYSNKWRIECSEKANSDGEIVFRVWPKGGAALEVKAWIEDGTGENKVADEIRKAFRLQTDRRQFQAERDDGEDVLVTRKGLAPVFAIELVRNTVRGVRLDLERE